MLNLENHQNKVKYLLIALAVILLAAIAISVVKFNRELKDDTKANNIVTSTNEKMINLSEKQLQELNDIRAKMQQDGQNLTEEQQKQQLDELEKIRQAQDL